MINIDDNRIVMTLDAGGTNFVFSAVSKGKQFVSPVTLPSNADSLDLCLNTIIKGFTLINNHLSAKPDAISFAFPGPADYPNGIIGDLMNLPGFKGGVPLKHILEEKFKIPVFINNDGDLFTYGEALAGILPFVNKKLADGGSTKRYHNLIGITLGTGLGGGLVCNNELIIGDNSNGGEIWIMSNRYNPTMNVEESISIRAIQRVYSEISNSNCDTTLTPFDIYQIGIVKKEGNKEAARESFKQMGMALGDLIANLIAVFDGIVVIGGGLSGAQELFLPYTLNELRSQYENYSENSYPRTMQKVFELDNESELNEFIIGKTEKIIVPETNKIIQYDSLKRTGIAISKLGTNRATSLGAYAFALNQLDKINNNQKFENK